MIKWKSKKNLNPRPILEKIDSIKSVSDNGRVSYGAFTYHEAFAALFSMIKFPDNLYDLNKDSIVAKGLSEAARKGPLTTESVIEAINNIASSQLASRENRYHLLTSISLSDGLPIRRLNVESSTIRFVGKNYPQKYSSRTKAINSMVYRDFIDEHKDYLKIVVTLKSKSDDGAVSNALHCLDLVRSGFAFFTNSAIELFGDMFSPINIVRLGQVHTLHKEDGTAVSDRVWFEPNFVPAKIFVPRNPDDLKKKIKWFLDKLNLCKYNDQLKKSLLRYVRALDEKDYNSSLIWLWGALESIAAPSESSYNSVTQRCASLFKSDIEYHYENKTRLDLR